MKKKKFKLPKIETVLDWLMLIFGGTFVILAIATYFGVI